MVDLVAYFFMTIDHVGKYLFDNNVDMRLLGRLSLPAFVFMFARGWAITKDRKKYFYRLLCLALLSQIPYMVLTESFELNIIFTFVISMVTLYLIDEGKRISAFCFLILLFLIPVEYGIYGVLCCLIFVKVSDLYQKYLYLIFVHISFVMITGAYIQLMALIIFPMIELMNDIEMLRDIRLPRAFKYSYYPVHLMVLVITIIYFKEI